MKIIEHTAPNLPKVKMLCDDVIDKRLTEHEAIDTCFARSSTTIVSGGTGSGKTTFIIQMIKGVFRKCFHDIIIMMPEESMRSIADKDNPFKKIDPDNIYTEFNVDTLSEVYTKIEDNAAEGYYTLLLIDDHGAALKDKQNEYILNRLFLKQRHMRLTTFVLVQNYYMMGRKIREIVTNVILFNTNKSQNYKVFREQFNMTQDQFNSLLKLLPTAHNYVLVNLKYKRMFVDFNEVTFDDEN